MSLRVCVLGSGSRGNCIYVGSSSTSILVDAGLSGRETARRLAEIGVPIDRIRGICLSHEHRDHTVGLRVLHGRHRIPVYANSGTVDGVRRMGKTAEVQWRIFSTGVPFDLGDLLVEPFSVPHDAYDPVGFIIGSDGARVGVVTDMGVPTTLIRERLRQCRVVVVEANHDERLLREAKRPWYLKQRIMGRQGHLSNESAAAMLAEIAGPDLRQVFLAHISDECNQSSLAVRTARSRLAGSGFAHIKVCATFPDRISDVWTA